MRTAMLVLICSSMAAVASGALAAPKEQVGGYLTAAWLKTECSGSISPRCVGFLKGYMDGVNLLPVEIDGQYFCAQRIDAEALRLSFLRYVEDQEHKVDEKPAAFILFQAPSKDYPCKHH